MRARAPFRYPLAVCLGAVLVLAIQPGCMSTAKIDMSAMSFSAEPLVGKVIWNDLITDDLATARRFYGDLFGWTFEQSAGRGGRPYLLAKAGKVYVAGIVEVAPHAKDTPESRWLPYISVTDVDGAVTAATTSGARIAVGPLNVGLGRVAAVVDKEGAVFGLVRSRIGDPDDTTTAPGDGRIVWTELLTNDPATAAQFYRAVVGYDVRTVERRGGQYTFLARQGTERAGVLRNPSEQAAPAWVTYFGVEDPRVAAQRVEALGGKVVLPPSPQLREGTMAVVTDPTGALLVLRTVSRKE